MRIRTGPIAAKTENRQSWDGQDLSGRLDGEAGLVYKCNDWKWRENNSVILAEMDKVFVAGKSLGTVKISLSNCELKMERAIGRVDKDIGDRTVKIS